MYLGGRINAFCHKRVQVAAISATSLLQTKLHQTHQPSSVMRRIWGIKQLTHEPSPVMRRIWGHQTPRWHQLCGAGCAVRPIEEFAVFWTPFFHLRCPSQIEREPCAALQWAPVPFYSLSVAFAGAAFLMWELSTPFLYLRWVLLKLGKADSKLAMLNSAIGFIVFFLCRNCFGPCKWGEIYWMLETGHQHIDG